MIFDLHNDFPTELPQNAHSDYVCNNNGATITAVIWTSKLDSAIQTVKDYTDKLSTDKILSHCPIAIEDIGFTAYNDLYKSFDFSKYFYCSLTWNYNNAFAGGALDDGELTQAGKDVISRICSSGCYVDLAHLNRKSFFEALDLTEHVICSHTGFNAHPRSLSGEQIRALVARNAVIGLCTVSAFTDAKNAIDFADIIDSFVQVYGDGSLAIGTDFNGSTDIPQDISDYEKFEQVAYLLENKGYGKTAIQNIFYNNAYSIFNHK